LNILGLGDLHIRATPTKWRTLEYYESLFGKLKWIFDFAVEQKCHIILQPGDFLDGPEVPNHTLKRLIQLILDYTGNVYVVAGQHDLRYRQLTNTSLAVLNEANVIEILTDKPIEYEETKLVHIYGASWDAKIPDPIDRNACNILVLHKMIVKDEPLFPEQTDYIKANDFTKQFNDYNLIISGDNHNSFSNITKSNSLINCGSLMRMTTAQYEHKPCVWLFDTITGEITQRYIPIKPVIEVFKPEVEELKKHNEKMNAFIKTLTSSNLDVQLSFEDNLKLLFDTTKITNEVRDLTNEFIKSYYE